MDYNSDFKSTESAKSITTSLSGPKHRVPSRTTVDKKLYRVQSSKKGQSRPVGAIGSSTFSELQQIPALQDPPKEKSEDEEKEFQNDLKVCDVSENSDKNCFSSQEKFADKYADKFKDVDLNAVLKNFKLVTLHLAISMLS